MRNRSTVLWGSLQSLLTRNRMYQFRIVHTLQSWLIIHIIYIRVRIHTYIGGAQIFKKSRRHKDGVKQALCLSPINIRATVPNLVTRDFCAQRHIYIYIYIYIYSYNKRQRDALFLKCIFVKNSTCFGQIYCPSRRVSTLYTQQ